MTRHIRIALAAGAALFAIGISAPASAQIGSPCNVLGSLMPPPCIVFDYKRLADMATKQSQELQTLQTWTSQVGQWKANVDSIGQEIGDVKNLAGTNLIPSMPTFDLGGILPSNPLDILSTKTALTSALYAGTSASNSDTAKVMNQRDNLTRAATTDALGYVYSNDARTAETIANIQKIEEAQSNSPDLRTDWAINSQARQELLRATQLQDYLWNSLIQVNSVNGIRYSDPAQPKDVFKPSTTIAAPSTQETDVWDLVRQIQALDAEAKQLILSLQIVQQGNDAVDTVQSVINDYKDAQSRYAALTQEYPQDIQNWACDNDHCNRAVNIISWTNSDLSSIDSTNATLRNESIDQLTAAGVFSNRGIDVTAMTNAGIDPRQFLGTWGDPGKYDGLMATLNPRLNDDDFDSWLDHHKDDYRNLVYALNDARLEVAWKQDSYDQAVADLPDIQALMAQQQTGGQQVSENTVQSRLNDIATQANALGAQLNASTDEGAKTAAQTALNDIQSIINTGTSAPVVDPNDQWADDGLDYSKSICNSGDTVGSACGPGAIDDKY